jgi:hypothetical protein
MLRQADPPGDERENERGGQVNGDREHEAPRARFRGQPPRSHAHTLVHRSLRAAGVFGEREGRFAQSAVDVQQTSQKRAASNEKFRGFPARRGDGTAIEGPIDSLAGATTTYRADLDDL